MNTPLYDALLRRAEKGTARFHMPGHKGRAVTPALDAVAALDFTELSDTGNLYVGGDVIQAAEDLWAAAWDLPACQFLTCGSTQGLHAALLLCARDRGAGILVDRCSHRSVYNALGLFDLAPAYLLRSQDTPVTPQMVESALENAGAGIKTLCITSPTYYGVLSDIPAIAAVCRRRDVALVVDGAHGAHLPFLGPDPFAGADLVVSSAHKTLPVWGQGALLFAGTGRFTPADLRWAASVCGTSSPSYPVMASLDWARAWMEGPGLEGYRKVSNFVEMCRKQFCPLVAERLDPARLTLCTPPGEGFAAAAALEELGVACEMADGDHVVFICTGADADADRRRLLAALEQTGRFRTADTGPMVLPPPPEVALTPKAALLARRERVVLRGAEGRVAAGQVAPYPPGVPVVAPGEVITKKCLAYLAQMGYNVDDEVDVVTS